MQQNTNKISWQKSLVIRAIIVAFTLSMCVQLVTNYFLYNNLKLRLIKELNEQQTSLLDITVNALGQSVWNFDNKQIQEQADAMKNNTTFCGVRVFDDKNNKLAQSDWAYTESNSLHQIFSRNIMFVDPRTNGTGKRNIGKVELCASKLQLFIELRQVMYQQILSTIAISLIMGVISLLALQLIVQPIKRFQTALKNFSNNRAPITDPELLYDNEIGRLSQHFNVMAEDLNNTHEKLTLAMAKAEHANQLKSEFLSNMSHELRTPMHAILAFSRQGMQKTNDKLIKDFFADIQNSGNRLVRLLNNLLDISKLESRKTVLHLHSINIIDLIKHSVKELDSLIKDKKIIVSIEHDNTIPTIDLDKDLLIQAIINLLSNAIKFTPEEKNIYVKISNDKMQLVESNGRKDIDAVKISVVDEGVGIPENELGVIFDKFVQSSKTKTGAGGTGLGLSICKEIITLHGGNIWASNNPDGGAIFTFIIPVNLETAIEP